MIEFFRLIGVDGDPDDPVKYEKVIVKNEFYNLVMLSKKRVRMEIERSMIESSSLTATKSKKRRAV